MNKLWQTAPYKKEFLINYPAHQRVVFSKPVDEEKEAPKDPFKKFDLGESFTTFLIIITSVIAILSACYLIYTLTQILPSLLQ